MINEQHPNSRYTREVLDLSVSTESSGMTQFQGIRTVPSHAHTSQSAIMEMTIIT